MTRRDPKIRQRSRRSGAAGQELERYNRWCLYVLVRMTFHLASRPQQKRWFGTTNKEEFFTRLERIFDRERRGSRKAKAEFEELFRAAEQLKDEILAKVEKRNKKE